MNSKLYKNKIILAPMVKMNTLPFRLLSLDYGADLVYCEELIDYKIINSERKINDVLETVDYVDKSDGSIVFRTCEREKDKLIFQIGTCCPKRAAQVAKMIEQDVAGIDINMGCPKEFSIKGGMGAALLTNVTKAKSILENVINVVQIPVTCKIRILNDMEQSLELCKQLQSTGISAIAIHGRTTYERPRHMNRNLTIKHIATNLDIPVIANGGSKEIKCYEDIFKFQDSTGSSSVMIARKAQHNPSIFRKDGVLPLDDVIKTFLRYAVQYDNSQASTKYSVQSMLKELQETPRGRLFLRSQTLQQICDLWELGDYCREEKEKQISRGFRGRWDVAPAKKKLKLDNTNDDDDDVTSLHCAFIRTTYPNCTDLPKARLHGLSLKQGCGRAKYNTTQSDKLFKSVVTFNGKKYSSTFWEKNKKFAEHSAAIVCLYSLGIYDMTKLKQFGAVT